MTKTMISTISKTYAKALIETNENPNQIKLQLDEINEVINSSSDLRIVMANSSIATSKKLEIIDSIFNDRISQKLLNFLKILIEKNRFNELQAITESLNFILEDMSNKKTVEITSPIELNFENKSNILFKLEHKLGCEIKPMWHIDKSLIAGLTFKIDDCVIDTSIRTKLENLNKNIIRG